MVVGFITMPTFTHSKEQSKFVRNHLCAFILNESASSTPFR